MPLITTLVAGLGIAFILGALAQRLRVSPIVGYLLAGVVIGPATPGIFADPELAGELAELGVILLMFGVGLHFSIADLLSVRRIALPGAVVQILIATLLGLGLALLLGWSIAAGLVFGLALSVASTVVLLRALQERRLLDPDQGRIAIGWLIVEDLAMVLALVLIPALAGFERALHMGSPRPIPRCRRAADVSLTAILSAVGITILKVAAFVALMLVVGRRLVPWILHSVAHSGSRELFRLSVLAIALGIAYGAAELFDVSFALGAFFAGMVLAESALSQQAAQESLPFRDAFAVLFFVAVGMLFDPHVLIEQPLAVIATVAIILFGKSVAAYAIVAPSGDRREPASSSPPASRRWANSRSSSPASASALPAAGGGPRPHPRRGDHLHPAQPGGFRRTRAVEGDRLAASEAGRTTPSGIGRRDRGGARAARPDDAVEPRCHRRLWAGRRHGRRATDRGGVPVLVIEENLDRVKDEQPRHRGDPGQRGARRYLAAANVAGARWLLVAIPEAFEASSIVSHSRKLNPGLTIIARAHFDAEVDSLREDGATVVMGEREIARGMVEQVLGSAPSV